MPTYEYACKSCGEDFEIFQSFVDDALTACPSCGGTLRKVFGNVGIVFKGSGFYKTDSRKGEDKSKVTVPSEAAATDGAKSVDAVPGDGGAGKAPSEGSASSGAPSSSGTSA